MITTHQIRNVLRIYGNQLKKRTMLLQESVPQQEQPSDSVSISLEARKKHMVGQISTNVISQITRNNYQPMTQESLIKDESI